MVLGIGRSEFKSGLTLLVVLPLLLGGCRGSDGETEPREDSGSTESGESLADAKTMAQLAALGYVDFVENTDESLSGVVQHDPAATAPGYSFYADHADHAYLIDLDGNVVHRWTLPDTEKSLFAELVSDGRLVVSLGQSTLAMIDRDSELIWELSLPAHHDVAVASDGSLFVLVHRWKVYEERKVLFDGIAHVSAAGELTDIWWTFDHLDELQRHHPLRPIDRAPDPEKEATQVRRDYYHANTIELLPDTPLGQRDPRFRAGNLMINLHQVNLVVVLDQDDMSVTWTWGGDELDWPHMPTMLDNGNILVFDNGAHRDYSRVLEIEPPSGEIVWSYVADPPESFFTKFRGCNQRLPNGNTLICESERGHAFEVTPGGRTVWEFWNPLIVDGKRRTISRIMRYPEEFVAPLLQ